MNPISRRITALLLAVLTCLSLVVCGKATTPSWEKEWGITDADYDTMQLIEVSTSKNEGTRYATLSSEDIIFASDVKSDDVRVVAYPLQKEAVSSMSEEDIAKNGDKLFKETLLDNVTVTGANDHTLSLSFQDPEYDYSCFYFFFVHKRVIESGVFAFANDNIYLESSVTAEAAITSALKNGQENPTIDIKLTNAVAAESIKAEDITLSGALANLKVTAAAASGDTVTVQTEGTVATSSAPYGYVQLSAPVTDADAIIMAMKEVEALGIYVNPQTFALADGLLRFDVELYGAEFAVSDKELAALVTLEGFEVVSTQIFADQNLFRLSVRSGAADVNEAVDSLFGKTLRIDGKAVDGTALTEEITASCASLGGVINSIDKVEGSANTYKATAQLFPRSGSMSELTADDLSFSGDFEGAVVTKVENVDNTTNVEFTFTAGENAATFDGYVELPQGKLYAMWGAKSTNTSAAISYAIETSRRRHTALEEITDKIGELSNENLISGISAIASAFMDSGITKFFSGDILGGLGSLFADVSPSGTEYEIHCIVTDMKLMMQNLDRDIKELKNSVQEYGDDILAAAQKNTLLALESKWNAFNTNYMERLDRTVASFNSACRRSLVDFVKSEHGEGLTLYYDVEGKLAILDKANSYYSVDAKKIDGSKTITVPLTDDSFKACQGVFEKTGFKYTNDFAIALMTDLGNAVKAMNASGNNALVYSDETGEMLFQYLYQQMMFKNLTSEFMDNMRADFVNFCKQITEGQKVLDSFYEMMSFKYNFQSEALEDMENIRNSLLVTLFNYGATAAFVENYDSATDNHDMSEAMEKAIGYINSHNGLYDEPEGYSYCYAVGRPITLRISDLKYYMKINFHSNNTLFPDDLEEWQYDGYDAYGPLAGYYRAYYEDGTKYSDKKGGLWWAFKKDKGYYTTDDLNADNRVSMTSKNILSAKDLGLLKARFNALKASGSFPEYSAWTFGEYLTNGKVVKAPSEFMIHLIPDSEFANSSYSIKPTRIAAAGYKETSFPVDGTRTLICNKYGLKDGLNFTQWFLDHYPRGTKYYEKLKYGGGGYFIPGKAYAIGEGTDEDGDATRPCFREHIECTMPIYDMTTDTIKNDYPVLQVALYGEHHSTWTTDEGAYFYNEDYAVPYFIFPIG